LWRTVLLVRDAPLNAQAQALCIEIAQLEGFARHRLSRFLWPSREPLALVRAPPTRLRTCVPRRGSLWTFRVDAESMGMATRVPCLLTIERTFSSLARTMQGLTQRQQMVLDYIRQSILDRGYPPTLREIGARMGIRSTNGVNDHLRALERKGYLTREDMKSRALRPTTLANQQLGQLPLEAVANDVDMVEVPILGRVAAGLPLLAEEHIVDTVRIDRTLLKGGREVFGLKVHGDSMIEAGILSGDYIFVKKQLTASRGEIVVALIGDEATVKYYFPEKDHVRFQPANKNMAPIYVRSGDFKPTMLLGVVVGVFRRV